MRARTINEYRSNSDPIYLKYAWLITWSGTEKWARPDDWRSIMAIISGRRSGKFIRDVLWVLDIRANHSAHGMTYYANRRQKYGLPYRCGPGWRTVHGSNAWLYARQVKDLSVSRDGKFEKIEWLEPDFVGNMPDTYQVEILDAGQRHSVTRCLDEHIGGEPYPRWE